MAKFKALDLVNVGPFESKHIELEKVMFMLGPNGYGKSTVLRAFNTALSGDYYSIL